MRILHTSDWHIGRSFHGFSTLPFLRQVLRSLVDLCVDHDVDVCIVAGDIFDSSTPSADAYEVLTEVLLWLREAGVTVIMTSGNHDSAIRLGFQSHFAAASGVHVLTGRDALSSPVDVLGVWFYGVPYLEPAIVRRWWPEVVTQDDAIRVALDEVRADFAGRTGRCVVVSHCFVVGVSADGPEKDITAGGLQYVSLDRFAGFDFAALGHIHSPHVLTDSVRYSGAPLHYSFSEAGRDRGAWLIDLDPDGPARSTWMELPVPRQLVELVGELDDLTGSPRFSDVEDSWVSAVLTDDVRPLDAMAKLRRRFPYCVRLEFRPTNVIESAGDFAQLIEGKSDVELVDEFMKHVRNGSGLKSVEREMVTDAFSSLVGRAVR